MLAAIRSLSAGDEAAGEDDVCWHVALRQEVHSVGLQLDAVCLQETKLQVKFVVIVLVLPSKGRATMVAAGRSVPAGDKAAGEDNEENKAAKHSCRRHASMLLLPSRGRVRRFRQPSRGGYSVPAGDEAAGEDDEAVKLQLNTDIIVLLMQQRQGQHVCSWTQSACRRHSCRGGQEETKLHVEEVGYRVADAAKLQAACCSRFCADFCAAPCCVLCAVLQEGDVEKIVKETGLTDWHVTFNCSTAKKGYSGTATLCR
jgi:hypothetical protein